jgi:CRISPR-associated endoribonuclease Cas6
MKYKYKFTINESKIPYDYRRGIISLFKEALTKSNMYMMLSLYKNDSRDKSKPLTFSVYFNNIKDIKNRQFLIKDFFELNLSTNDIILGATIYNGIKDIREFNFFGNIIKPSSITILPPKRIKSNEAIFKTLSPLLINDKNDSNKYLTPQDEKFLDNVKYYANELSEVYLKRKLENFEFNIQEMKKSVYSHYNQAMPGITGIFKIKSDSEFLNLINDIGFGDRRSQGFGMLEVIK